MVTICPICKKEITNNNGRVCDTCERFFEWKYGKNYQRFIDRHLKASGLEKLISTKSRRKK